MPKSPSTILWLRRDLRLHDNPALAAAAVNGEHVIPVFIEDEPSLGGAARWWRGQSLMALSASLEKLGSRLVLRKGDALDQLLSIFQETGAGSLHVNRRFEPLGLSQDARIMTELRGMGIRIHEHGGNRLHEPWSLKTQKGEPFRVFTPFWRRLTETYLPPPRLAAPKFLETPATWPYSADLADIQVKAGWTEGMSSIWQPGENGAITLLEMFKSKLPDYAEHRDRPDIAGSSRLSPHLAWGEVSVHEVWRRFCGEDNRTANGFLRELGWRDFNTHLLYHFPHLPTRSWNPRFAAFPFEDAKECLAAWKKGLTGYPIVDAGMRELWATGWMHNRVRMIVASFLVKDLLIDWRDGQAWFWKTLVDADLAQNAGNWQWVAGSGADAAPYFRVFNPTTQSIKFDPEGTYIRRWLPELAHLPTALIHEPAAAPHAALVAANICLGKDYPWPIVDHGKARLRALEIYKRLAGGKSDDESPTRRPARQSTLF